MVGNWANKRPRGHEGLRLQPESRVGYNSVIRVEFGEHQPQLFWDHKKCIWHADKPAGDGELGCSARYYEPAAECGGTNRRHGIVHGTILWGAAVYLSMAAWRRRLRSAQQHKCF